MLENNPQNSVKLDTYAHLSFLPMVLSTVENSAVAFGAGKAEALRLTLAVEEIFVHICAIASRAEAVEVICENGIYFQKVYLEVTAQDLDLKALNIVYKISPNDENSLADLGLLIAARSVSRFAINKKSPNSIIFEVEVDKNYPKALPVNSEQYGVEAGRFKIVLATRDQVKDFVYRLVQTYPSDKFPSDFSFPGKLVDMVNSAEYNLLIAENEKNQICGGIIWKQLQIKMVECFGPYLFLEKQNKRISEGLTEGCIERIARTGSLGLINAYPTHEMPKGYFEHLGNLTDFTCSPPCNIPIFYRHLHEDLGTTVWAGKKIIPFLEIQYQKNFLPRRIQPVRHEGEALSLHSVLSSEFKPSIQQVTLRPVLSGIDFKENLHKHLQYMDKEGYINVIFEMDLGISSHALWSSALVENNFKPKVILPYAGEADLVIFQYDNES